MKWGGVWDVAALFRFAVAFTIGVTGAGSDHAGAGAFLDDVVDHVLPLQITFVLVCLQDSLTAIRSKSNSTAAAAHAWFALHSNSRSAAA